MLLKVVISSIRYRAKLLIPMIMAVSISLSMLGSSVILEKSFEDVVEENLKIYGANVIVTDVSDFKPKNPSDEFIAISLKSARIGNYEVILAITNVDKLLSINPAWFVRGNGEIIVGRELADALMLSQEDIIEVDRYKGRVAILDSGTEFDGYIIVNGSAKNPSLILVKAENPEEYKDESVIILKEFVRTKYSFLEGMSRILFIASLISAIASFVAIVNLARIDAGKRVNEFGILKALGATNRLITKILLVEFLVISAISSITGSMISVIVSWVVMNKIAKISPTLNFDALGLILIVTILSFSVLCLLYLNESKRRGVIEILRGE